MQKLIDLLRDIIAFIKKAFGTGDWEPSSVKNLEPLVTPKKRGRGRPKGSKNKKKK